MSDLKPGWYWVVINGGWECAKHELGEWHVTGADCEWQENQLDEVGPRIPTPDEPWQMVPNTALVHAINASYAIEAGDEGSAAAALAKFRRIIEEE